MAARRRAQERDFNRRRRLILDKGLDRAYNQKDTAFGECLLKWNIREEQQLQQRQRRLGRQQHAAVTHKEQEKRQFVVLRDQATREPTLLLQRSPSAEQYADFVDFGQPRYMRPLEARQGKIPEFEILSIFQAVKKRKRNIWEDAVKEDVQFRPTLCPCPRLSSDDTGKLTTSWMQINELQSKSLGFVTDNRSAPARAVRTGMNPMGLPSRLNSRLNHRAADLLDEISSPSASDAGSGPDDEDPVFITQLPKSQDLVFDEEKDKKKKEKLAAHKRQVDAALTSLYDLLQQRRVAGQPPLRVGRPRYTFGHRQDAGGGSRPTTVSSGVSGSTLASRGSSRAARPETQTTEEQVRTTCRTAESVSILLESRRRVRRPRHLCHQQEQQQEQQEQQQEEQQEQQEQQEERSVAKDTDSR